MSKRITMKLANSIGDTIPDSRPRVTVQEQKGQIVISYTFPKFDMLPKKYYHRKSRFSGLQNIVLSSKVNFLTSHNPSKKQGNYALKLDQQPEVVQEAQPLIATQIDIEGTGFLSVADKALLPMFSRYVQIPFNCRCEPEVLEHEPVVHDDILVVPAQGEFMDTPEQGHILRYDQAWYEHTNGPYPDEMVTVTDPFEMDGYKVVLIRVIPFQYYPVEKKLIGYGNITVKLKVFPKDKGNDVPYSEPSASLEAFGNLILNPRRGNEARLGFNVKRIADPPLESPEARCEFLIIYPPGFEAAAERLVEWKRRRGLDTEMRNIKDIGNTVKQIKDYIRHRRSSLSLQLRYVLLLGDVDKIPAEHIEGGRHGSNVTDYYYSTPEEPSVRTPLVFPWLAIGRIPVQTAEEALQVVERIVAYEKNPPQDSGYYQKLTFIAEFEDRDADGTDERAFIKTVEDINKRIKASKNSGLKVERLYVHNSSQAKPKRNIDGTDLKAEVTNIIVRDGSNALKSALEQGRLLIAYRGHGTRLGWTYPRLHTYDLDSIAPPQSAPSVLYSITCSVGMFDATRDSLAEMLLKKGLAVSLIAASRPSQTWLNNDLIKALFDATWVGVIPPVAHTTATYSMKYNRLGDILNYGKFYLPIKKDESEAIKDHFEVYHLIGDPTLELWTAKPQEIKLRLYLERTARNLHVKLLPACPVNSLITIWHNKERLKRIEVSSTLLTVSVRDVPPGAQISVCFWAPGYRFYQEDIVG